MTLLEKIIKSNEALRRAEKEHSKLVMSYVNKVDVTSWSELDTAILELPESKEKLFIYDAMYDLKEIKGKTV